LRRNLPPVALPSVPVAESSPLNQPEIDRRQQAGAIVRCTQHPWQRRCSFWHALDNCRAEEQDRSGGRLVPRCPMGHIPRSGSVGEVLLAQLWLGRGRRCAINAVIAGVGGDHLTEITHNDLSLYLHETNAV
jgi:hypothetical protein